MLKYVFIDVDVQARYAVQPFDVRDAPALQDVTCYISSLPLGAHRRRDDLHGPFSDGFRLRIAMRRVHVLGPVECESSWPGDMLLHRCCVKRHLSTWDASRYSLHHGSLLISTASSSTAMQCLQPTCHRHFTHRLRTLPTIRRNDRRQASFYLFFCSLDH